MGLCLAAMLLLASPAYAQAPPDSDFEVTTLDDGPVNLNAT
jgi:hypothetical protein